MRRVQRKPLIVVIDTNVWISALHFGRTDSVPLRAVERALRDDIIATSPELRLEVFRVLTEKFGWSEDHAAYQLDQFHARSISVQLTHTTRICRDPKDNMFLQCAAIAKADVIVAGDNDLRVLGSYAGARILTPLQYVEAD